MKLLLHKAWVVVVVAAQTVRAWNRQALYLPLSWWGRRHTKATASWV